MLMKVLSFAKAGIELPIMVMNPEAASFEAMIQHKLEPEIYSLSLLDRFVKVLRVMNPDDLKGRFPIHIKLDTGMHRLGFEQRDINQLLEKLQVSDIVRVQSIFSHLAASEDPKQDDFTKSQINSFKKMSDKLIKELNYPIDRHILNSTGIVRHLKEAEFEMVRLGLGLYGLDTSGVISKKIKPVSRLKTTVSQVKKVKKGETIGYGREGKVRKESKVATVAIGYADGLSRRLSNGKGHMIIRGKKAKIIGNVCMDMTMLDVTSIKDVAAGDEVEVFGPELSIDDLAKQEGTIPYEILTGISHRVKRVYFQE